MADRISKYYFPDPAVIEAEVQALVTITDLEGIDGTDVVATAASGTTDGFFTVAGEASAAGTMVIYIPLTHIPSIDLGKYTRAVSAGFLGVKSGGGTDSFISAIGVYQLVPVSESTDIAMTLVGDLVETGWLDDEYVDTDFVEDIVVTFNTPRFYHNGPVFLGITFSIDEEVVDFDIAIRAHGYITVDNAGYDFPSFDTDQTPPAAGLP